MLNCLTLGAGILVGPIKLPLSNHSLEPLSYNILNFQCGGLSVIVISKHWIMVNEEYATIIIYIFIRSMDQYEGTRKRSSQS